MNAQTLAVLNDLKSKGLDTSSLEAQVKANPILDKQMDSIIGGGLLRQSEYTRLSNEIVRKEEDYKKQIQDLASSHDAMKGLDQNSELYKALLERTTALEEVLIETGLYDEDSIKNVSFKEKKAIEELITTPPKKDPALNSERKIEVTFDPTKNYVDADELQLTTANMATGSILMNMRLNRMTEEARTLGINITSELQEKFDRAFVTNVVQGNKKVEEVFDEVYGLSTVRQTKAEELRQKELTDARAAGRAEGLQEAGVPSRQITHLGRHSILDSKSIGKNSNIINKKDDFRNEEGNLDPTKLPRNDRGEVERYKLRGSKEDRLAKANAGMAAVTEHYANDITYVE